MLSSRARRNLFAWAGERIILATSFPAGASGGASGNRKAKSNINSSLECLIAAMLDY